jgi:hypothetical protein
MDTDFFGEGRKGFTRISRIGADSFPDKEWGKIREIRG